MTGPAGTELELKRDHFGTTIGGYSVAQQVEKHLAELRAAQN